MCGIFCSLSTTTHTFPDSDVLELLRRRGPDSTASITRIAEGLDGNGNAEQTFLTFVSTVLSLRGSETVSQPHQDFKGSFVACWNGEAWAIGGQQTQGNDTLAVSETLSRAILASQEVESWDREEVPVEHDCIARSLASIAGPYAFVYYSGVSCKLYFGRDFLGRRSLLWKSGDNDELILSSVASGSAKGAWSEVEADGVYCIDLASKGNEVQSADSSALRWSNYKVTKRPYIFADESAKDDHPSVIPSLSLNEHISAEQAPLSSASPSVHMLEQLLSKSLALRVLGIPNPPLPLPTESKSARLAILFSGGLDCTVLARIAHGFLPTSEPIDLLNVAFENPRIHKPATADGIANTAAYESCPDRITGRASCKELQDICPQRDWRFVNIDVSYSETMQHRDQIITLMHPHNTEMDLSIASALYFAARGKGRISTGPDHRPVQYITAARVLLSGLGADELFAGYTRHATAFSRHGFEGLLEELNLDIGRLGKRNLGRDDRVISNWGREVRFPFLDERLVDWALRAPVSDKCDFGAAFPAENSSTDPSETLEYGKKVLRCLAWKLDMRKVASEKKRAIQFGARTAKMQTGKTKGTTLLS